jgi:hypothetical protein
MLDAEETLFVTTKSMFLGPYCMFENLGFVYEITKGFKRLRE